MSELVDYDKRGAVAVITVQNPPVNALSFGVPDGTSTASRARPPTTRSPPLC